MKSRIHKQRKYKKLVSNPLLYTKVSFLSLGDILEINHKPIQVSVFQLYRYYENNIRRF